MKSKATLELEKLIYNETAKRGVFGCFEVTIGWNGKERVDYMTIDTNGIIKCYELKASVSDFRSKNHISFFGHYNYYVLTNEVYQAVKQEIPDGIGVYVGNMLVKKARSCSCGISEEKLKSYFIRSLSREVDKLYKNLDENNFVRLQEESREAKRAKERTESDYDELLLFIYQKFGWMWQNEFEEWKESSSKAQKNHLREEIVHKMADSRRDIRKRTDLTDEEKWNSSSNCVWRFKKF